MKWDIDKLEKTIQNASKTLKVEEDALKNTIIECDKKDDTNSLKDMMSDILIVEEKEEKEEKEDIDELYEEIKEMIPVFNKNQEELHQISEEFQKELQILRNNVSTVENMIDFLKKLPEEQKNEESMKVIIENMNQLCRKIMNIGEAVKQTNSEMKDLLRQKWKEVNGNED